MGNDKPSGRGVGGEGYLPRRFIMLIQIHILQNYVPANLNRDDSGSPKSAVFGGIVKDVA